MKILILSSLMMMSIQAQAKLSVAATTTDVAAVIRQVGGDLVEVTTFAKGTQDPHHLEAKPSFMIKLRGVSLIVAQGLELESAWLTPLIQGARNPKLVGPEGLLELGPLLEPIEIPSAGFSRADGDIHAGGNPHFQLDPIRLGKAAVLIAKRFGEIDPQNKKIYETNALEFQKRMQAKTNEWEARLKKASVSEIITYHKNFSYFCARFGIKCSLQLEPKPGVPPSAAHLLSVVQQARQRQIKLVLIENFFDDGVGKKLIQDLPALRVARVAVSVDGEPGASTNESLIEKLIQTIEGTKP